MPLDYFHLVGFEKSIVTSVQRVQFKRLMASFPDRTEMNEREALARGLIGCAAAWVLVGIPFVMIALVLQLTIGSWCLFSYGVVVGCVVMNCLRIRQSKRLLSTHTR